VHILAALAGVATPGLVFAQLSFSQSPPLAAQDEVKPDIILSIDDSGSMQQNQDVTEIINGNPQMVTRIQALKDALLGNNGISSPFAAGSPYLGKFRLAFEAMWNNRGFGPNRFFIPNDAKGQQIDNSMRVFDASQVAPFANWVNTLTGTGDLSNGLFSTPSQLMIIYAGEYLRNRWLSNADKFNTTTSSNYKRLDFTSVPSSDNPWNETPGVADSNPLSCRRSYFIFMTDGMWNMDESGPVNLTTGNYIFMPFVSDVSGGSVTTDANYDGAKHALPPAPGLTYTSYDPSSYSIYADSSPSPITSSSQSGYSAYSIKLPYSPTATPVGNPPTSYSVPNLCDTTLIGFGYYNSKNEIIWVPTISSGVQPTACSSTLSDFSLYYWANNLSGDKTYSVIPQMNVTDNQTYTYDGKTEIYPPFWNPQNDPATWQHMQTYTIGYGTQANGGAGELKQNGQIAGYDSLYGNFFLQFATGYQSWPIAFSGGDPNNLYDLVHAAYNGRGKFYPATSANTLADAFADIIKVAVTQSSPGGIASASASNSRVSNNSIIYEAIYNFDSSKTAYDVNLNQWGVTTHGTMTGTINGWSGLLMAYAGNNLYAAPLWANGATIPAASRNVFTASATGGGIPFAWSGLSSDPLVTTSGLTQTDVNAVLGNPLGDIVDSQLAYVGQPSRLMLDSTYSAQFVTAVNGFNSSNAYREGVVYVGANDGMLHGFDAGQGTPDVPGSGQELMAYVPRGLFAALHADTFASASYVHHDWVDGSPFSGDVQLGTNGYGAGTDGTSNPGHWATVLAGTLGAGGPGYFVLDVTDPGLFSASNAGKLVLLDATDTTDTSPLAGQTITNGPQAGQPVLDYIGYQFNQPVMEMYTTNQSAQIVQINTQDQIDVQGTPQNREWAVIMGNGYNSASGVPVLLIQSLSHPGRPLYTVSAVCTSTVSTCKAAGNGLGAPRPVDVDGNGTADIVYAGDLMGNLWKFDISNPDHTQWRVANGTNDQPAPMFTAVGPTGVAQPITSAPAAVPDPNGGFMVILGTGKNLTDTDLADTNLNSVYALYDNQHMAAGTTPLPGDTTTASQVVLDNTTFSSPSMPLTPFCTASGSASRYGCLYQQTGGAISSNSGATTHYQRAGGGA
jgi:type IV pilus assembly protein PilY1